jgi:hypothetical protein
MARTKGYFPNQMQQHEKANPIDVSEQLIKYKLTCCETDKFRQKWNL